MRLKNVKLKTLNSYLIPKNFSLGMCLGKVMLQNLLHVIIMLNGKCS